MGGLGSNHRPSDIDKPDRQSTPVPSGFPNEGRGLPAPARLSTSSDGSEQQEQERGHYRGITFEEILPAHLIMNAPPPAVEQQKKGSARSPKPAKERPTEPPPTKRSSYPAMKRSGTKSRFRDTARALVRRFSVSVTKKEKDSRRRSGYEVV